MSIIRRLFLTASTILLLSSTLTGQGYSIEVAISGLSRDTLILGEYFTSRMVPKDTIVVNEKGVGRFEGSDPFQGGLYLIYFSPGYYFDLLLGDDQEFKVKADTSDFAGSATFDGSEDNQIFQEYKSFLQRKRGELENQQAQLANAATGSDTAAIRDRQKQINVEMEEYMNKINHEHVSLFVSDFIGATRESFPPEDILTGERKHDDSIRYFYYRQHYFDRF